jgi:hypothetical protein
MKTNFNKFMLACCALILTLFFSLNTENAKAQVGINEGFESITTLPSGWVGTSWFNTTTLPCTGLRSIRTNLWSSGPQRNIAPPAWISNGNDLTITFDYKIINFSAPNAATPAGWGNMKLQYSVDGGTTYIDYFTIDDVNHVVSASCAPVNLTIPGASLPSGNNIRVRWFGQWVTGDYYFYLDNVVLFQEATTPPACNAALTTPANNAINANITGDLAWSAASGVPTGYNVTVTQITGGPTVIFNQTLGSATTVNVGVLQFSTQYSVDIVPFNSFGSATGCSSYTFTTQDPPLPGVICFIPLDITSLPYTTTDNTVNYGDDYGSVNLPAGPALNPAPVSTGTLSGSYLNGDDVVYSFTPSENMGVNITIPSGHGTWLGLYVFTGCPFSQTVAFHLASSSTGRAINNLPLVGGTTYYIVISTFAAPQSTAYTLNIEENIFDCPQINANIGSPCNDNEPTTFNDVVQADCSCAGTPYDCPQLLANIGSPCNDNDPTTINDVILANCTCLGTPLPENDGPCGAESIACNSSVSGTTAGSAADVLGLCGTTDGTGGGLWYLLNNDEGALVTLTTCGSAFDTKLRVFSGSCDGLVCVGGNDDSQACVPLGQSGLLSQVIFTALPNTNYYILVHGFSTAQGAFTLNVDCNTFDCPQINANIGDACDDGIPGTFNDTVQEDCTCVGTPYDCQNLNANIGSPCDDGDAATFGDVVLADCTCVGTPAQTNDTACQAFDIACGASVSGTTLGTTAEVLGTCGTTDGTNGGVWYRLNNPTNANVVLNTCGSLFDTKVRVFSGTCDALVCVGGNDDSQTCVPLGQSGLLSTVAFTASANTDYFILVHGFGAAAGSYTLNVSCETILDCPDLGANIGDACDDGDAGTFNDVVGADCICAGTPYDCPALSANIGDACDDGDANTENDIVGADCTCAGTPITTCNVDGGTVSSANQLTQLCKGDGQQDLVQLTVTGNSGAGLFGIVRQSDLQVVATNANGLFNIENLPAGNYFAGYVSVENLSQLAGITNVNQLSGCFDLSNQLPVTSIQLAGGTISSGGVTQVCGGTVTVTRVGNQGPQSRFALLNQTATTVITSNQTGVFNFTSLADGIYRIVSISFTGSVNLGQITPPTLPACVASSNLVTVTKITCPSALLESSPNPTSGTSFVTFSVPTEEYTTLEVYDMSGRKVAELFNGVTESNTDYRLEFNGVGLPNGVYIYRLTNASEVIIEKFMIAK